MVQKSERNSTVELLRCIFMYLIVVHHVFVHGVENYDDVYMMAENPSKILHFLIFLLGKGGVMGFIFISGFYGIKFSSKKVLHYVLNICFYLITIQIIANQPIFDIVASSLHPYDKWWFARYYLVLMIISPLLNNSWELLNFRNKTFIVGFLIYIFFIGHFRVDSHDMMVMIVIYIVAKYIREYFDENSNIIKYFNYAAIISLIIYCLIPFVVLKNGNDIASVGWVSHNNIFLLLSIGGAVLWANKHPSRLPFINYISVSLLAVYLITDSTYLWYNYPKLLPLMYDGWGYLLCLAAFAGCIFIDKIKALIFLWVSNVYSHCLKSKSL